MVDYLEDCFFDSPDIYKALCVYVCVFVCLSADNSGTGWAVVFKFSK